MTVELDYPHKDKRMLLLACCAPCAVEAIERLSKNNVDFSVLFYAPNIHPQSEYALRKMQLEKVCKYFNVPMITLDNDSEEWFVHIKGLEDSPERGPRCFKCFEFRLDRASKYAVKHDFEIISSTLAASRWKSAKQVEKVSRMIEQRFEKITYYNMELRKKGAQERRLELIKEFKLYQQDYCGCIYSKVNNKIK